MDEVLEVVEGNPWPKEDFTDACVLYRHCHFSKRERISKKERRHPSESSFTLRTDEDALSFNWGRYADSVRGHILLGLIYNNSGTYLNSTDYTFFKYPYNILSKIDGVSQIKHNPDYNGNPSRVGNPNNKSHSLVFVDSDDLGIRVNLADYARENYETSKCIVDHSVISVELDQLRKRMNDTEYHKLWEFNKAG